ncbi:mitochondrial ribosomal subunit S27-domain-containing protein [Stachybotrys elegans]|uniref:Small ribosomal subunit protein mS33 n=1 Tax=Stachybotrys elegans TaxID=80388 RepID=A0A8K0WSU1_9HYPO|nr:mitochondrial ribosomal subunit S27-domain-containing protein [Stachybotrys elegans]
MGVPRARLLDLMKAQSQVFATAFNPDGIRMGNKVLRQRLKGPALASYYPRKLATVKDVRQEFGPVLSTWDEKEEARMDLVEELKARGKGNPKKLSAPPPKAPERKKGK